MKLSLSLFVMAFLLLPVHKLFAQPTFPQNDVSDPRHHYYAFTGATIIKDANTTLTNAILLIRDGKIVALGSNLKVPAGAVVVDVKGKYIYPSFIDIYSDYGMPPVQSRQGGYNYSARAQLTSNTKGAYGWNQAIRPEVEASKLFTTDEKGQNPARPWLWRGAYPYERWHCPWHRFGSNP